MFKIRHMQDKLFTSNYHRSSEMPQPQVGAEESKKEAEQLKNMYSKIKEETEQINSQKVDKMK